jgi:hypothetical protein
MLLIPLLAILMVPASGTSAPLRPVPGTMPPGTTPTKPQSTSVTNAAATPATITFRAINPDTTTLVPGSAAVSVTWQTPGNLFGAWSLKVSAPSTFGSCGTVPASAVTVTCGSVTGGLNGACGGATTLSPGGAQIASGTEGFITTTSYSVSLTFTLQDSWKYVASSSCSLSVSYLITAN